MIHEELQQFQLFKNLSNLQLAKLKSTSHPIHLEANQLLFEHGQQADHFFLVKTGRIKLYRLSLDGKEKVIEMIPPHHTFAEAVMFMQRHVYPVSAQALEPTEIISFNNDTYMQLLRESPENCFQLLGDLSMRLRSLIDEIDNLTLQNATYRFIGFLQQQLVVQADEPLAVLLDIPKNILASRLSIQPETLSRILKNLVSAGIIRVEGKVIKIQDINKLRHYLIDD
jgi:CRP/FNR family transcriptional regulator, dissimilatory nitrate respiration regulator